MTKLDNLEDEILQKIFDLLDGESLKTAMEVCKKWNRMIGGNSTTMSKSKFVFPENWKNCTAEIQAMSRLVTTIEFHEIMTIDDPDICKVLKKFDMQFKVMIFDDVNIESQIFRELVSMFQLDKLIVYESTIFNESDRYGASNPSTTPSTPSDHTGHVLKLIALANANAQTMEVLADAKLQCIKLAYKNTDDCDLHMNPELKPSVTKFMQLQQNLKDLVLKVPISPPIMPLMVQQLRHSKLEKLSIFFAAGTYVPPVYDGVADLIVSQPALKELEILGEAISSRVMNAIYQLEELESLKMKIRYLYLDPESVVPCGPQTKLKTLKIGFLATLPETLDGIFKVFTNVETLGINNMGKFDDSNGIMLSVQNHLKSLKYLEYYYIFSNFPTLSIPSLQKFQVGCVVSSEKFQSFLSANQQLQELETDRIYTCMTDDGTLKLPRDLVNLQKLSIGSGMGYLLVKKPFELNQKVLCDLKERCTALKTVHIDEDANMKIAEDIKDFQPIKVVKFSREKERNVFDTFSKSAFSDKERADDVDMKCIRWTNGDMDGYRDKPNRETDDER